MDTKEKTRVFPLPRPQRRMRGEARSEIGHAVKVGMVAVGIALGANVQAGGLGDLAKQIMVNGGTDFIIDVLAGKDAGRAASDAGHEAGREGAKGVFGSGNVRQYERAQREVEREKRAEQRAIERAERDQRRAQRSAEREAASAARAAAREARRLERAQKRAERRAAGNSAQSSAAPSASLAAGQVAMHTAADGSMGAEGVTANGAAWSYNCSKDGQNIILDAKAWEGVTGELVRTSGMDCVKMAESGAKRAHSADTAQTAAVSTAVQSAGSSLS